MMLSPLAPTTAASSEEYQDPIAFIQSDWNVTLESFSSNYPLITTGTFNGVPNFHGNGDGNEIYGYDEQGNFYFAFVEDYVTVGGSSTSERGIHVVKVSENGSIEWIESIVSSYYNCRYDSVYCKVMSLEITGEDQFYLLASTYGSQTLEFSSNLSLSVTGQQLVIAYHDTSGWSWAESVTSSDGHAYTSVIHTELDSSNDIVITMRDANTGGYTEYSVISYSPSGGKWNRQLDVYYGSPTYGNSPILMDVEGTTIHYFALTKNNLRYDSQSTQCPANLIVPSFNGFCYVWISINSNGVKLSDQAIEYPSIEFYQFEVIQSNAYLYGESTDVVDSSYDEVTIFNSTQQSYSHEVSVICSYDSAGNIRYNQTVGHAFEDNWYLSSPVYEEDGSAFIFTFQLSIWPVSTTYDGVNLENYTNKQYERTIIKIDNFGNHIWHTGIGSDNDNLLDGTSSLRQSFTSSSGYISLTALTEGNSDIVYPGGVVTPVDGNVYAGIWWFSKDNGTLLDYENGVAGFPLASSREGGLMTLGIYPDSDSLNYYMPDNDGDNVGTGDNCPETYNPSQADYDSDTDGDACDDDDDNDGIEDLFDYCQRGELNWISGSLTDHDGDGCKDSTEEDLDDDNDGRSDLNDQCPFGIIGAGNDFDADGCKDLEDNDDDNDGVADGSDLCDKGDIDWSSGTVTDHDGDGCNDATEDSDDDNDGVSDLGDSCPKGATDWPSNLNTDFDEDGCKDGFEDEDDDNDGVINPSDNCPNSVGTVDEKGCSASQNIDDSGNNGNGDNPTVVYYVCPQGGLVVTELTDCPPVDNNNNTDNQQEPITQFYYVCPGGSEIVTDMADCPEGLPSTAQNITYVIDPDSNYSDDFSVCPGGTVLVKDPNDCSSQDSDDSTDTSEKNSNQESGSTDTIVLVFAGGAFLLAMAAVLLVLVRKPVSADMNFARLESADTLFKESSSPIASTPLKKPPSDIIGSVKDGYEWVEWPPGTDSHWFRAENSSEDWSQYGN